ncbi:hypothetical protein FRB94_014747 [Tulasnella sp. JGI-2019a]|nr:hypothetical protein FRB93_004118 [Tulasnella sp. JGI-2019a]KAG8989018.1 hypothetical protein FRB94_014747 [Tulasnella sp. JGI-2019a]
MDLPPDLKGYTALTPVATSPVDDHTMSWTGIDNLPVELLVEIFGYTSGIYGSFFGAHTSPYISKLHGMAQVCRRWLEIIKDAAKLWTFVTDRTPAYASLALKRSQSHTINLSIASRPLDRLLYAAVLNHSHRWIRADIRLSRPNQEALHMLETVSAPMLRHLKLVVPSWNTNTVVTLDLFPDQPPKLASLALIAVSIHRWNSPIFGCHLHSLVISRTYSSGPTREDLVGIFRACPTLENMDLSFITFPGETSRSLAQGLPVQLPLLRTLLLSQISSNDLIDIARMAEIPRCRNYSVFRCRRKLRSVTLPAITGQIQRPFEACIASSRSLEVHLKNNCIHIICRPIQSPSSDFNLKLSELLSCAKVIEWLNSILLVRRPPLSPLPIDVHLQYSQPLRPPPSPSDLLRLSNVQSLTISDSSGFTTNQLVVALSTPRDLEDGSNGWMWPGLREMNVEAFNDPMRSLFHMVKMRTEAALRQKEAKETSGVAILERLEVGKDVFSAEEFEAVRTALGHAVVMKPDRSEA